MPFATERLDGSTLDPTGTMPPENPCEVRPRSPQKQLEDARSQLLRNYFQKEEPIKRRSFWESQRKRWPEEATYLREEIAPEGYAGRVENIYGLNKNKQKFSQFQHSPSRQLQSRLKANARQAEAKEAADKAVAKRRIQRGSLSNGKAEGASGPARDWMAELERDLSWTNLCSEAGRKEVLERRKRSEAGDVHAQLQEARESKTSNLTDR